MDETPTPAERTAGMPLPRPQPRPLPPGALRLPPADPAAQEAARKVAAARRQVAQAADYLMRQNPYPDTRQGRRRWARELAKATTGRRRR